MPTIERVNELLNREFRPVFLEVKDDSHLHANHLEAASAGGTHFSVLIVSDHFRHTSFLERHRQIYACLQSELESEIHALAICAYTAQEYIERNLKEGQE